MGVFVDQMGNNVKVPGRPRRIVSLVPSQSEFLWDIGVKEQLAGITRFCIHPKQMFEQVPRMGGTKKLNLHKIRALNPDLIIGNKEENSMEQILELQKEFPVWMSDIVSLQDAFKMMTDLGGITGHQEAANQVTGTIRLSLNSVKNLFDGRSVAYLIWNDPIMLAASGTFIHEVLTFLGFRNVAGHLDRYPEMTLQQLAAFEADLIFLSSEPYPFKEKHLDLFNRELPASRPFLVDGEMFSWYGSRLALLAGYAKKLKAGLTSP